MNSVDQARATQLANIELRSGKSLDELAAIVRASGRTRHGEIRDLLKTELGMGYGDANTFAHYYLKPEGERPGDTPTVSPDDALDAIYAGAKAELRPVHDAVIGAIAELGPFEVAPKKANVSLRRKKQFATVGPASKGRVEVGVNARGLAPTERLTELPAGGMCQYRVYLTRADEVDAELMGWIRAAYSSAG
ncbi:MAG TPA: DUF5655 domain-containing protein [Longimicrobium sp.]|jgi:hypothetical protein